MVIVLSALALFGTTAPAQAHDLVWPGEKLEAMVPEAESFEQRNLYLTGEKRAAVEKNLGRTLPPEDLEPSVYLSVVRESPEAPPRRTAAMMFIDAVGVNGVIEMGVVVGPDGNLARVLLFENEEPRSVASPDFLSQFEGKSADEPFHVGEDITSPSGAEQSAQAIASGARRGLVIINELFKR